MVTAARYWHEFSMARRVTRARTVRMKTATAIVLEQLLSPQNCRTIRSVIVDPGFRMVDLVRPVSGRSPQTGGVAQQTEPTNGELFSSLIAPAVVFARTVTMVAVHLCWPNSKAQDCQS